MAETVEQILATESLSSDNLKRLKPRQNGTTSNFRKFKVALYICLPYLENVFKLCKKLHLN